MRVEFYIPGMPDLPEPYHYSESGLDTIFLRNGVSIERTPYGDMVTIQNLNALHMAIGLHIIEEPNQMSGSEFRFLRKQMELTQKALARGMNVTDQTIANYEKDNTAERGPANALMRLRYLLHVLPDDTRARLIKQLSAASGPNGRRKLPDVPRRKLIQPWHDKEAA